MAGFPPFPMGPSSLALHVSFIGAHVRWVSTRSNQVHPHPLNVCNSSSARFSALLCGQRAGSMQRLPTKARISQHISSLLVSVTRLYCWTWLTCRVSQPSCSEAVDNNWGVERLGSWSRQTTIVQTLIST